MTNRPNIGGGITELAAGAPAPESAPSFSSLNTENLLFETLVDSMAEGVAVHDHDGSVIHTNAAAEKIFGITTEMMRGEHAVTLGWTLLDESGSPLPTDQIPSEVTRRTGQSCRDRILCVEQPGEAPTWISVNTDPLDPPGDTPPRVVATFRDITSEREAFAALQQHRDRLEQTLATVPGIVMEGRLTADDTLDLEFVSAGSLEILGIASNELEAAPALFWNGVAHQDREELRRVIQQADESTQFDFRFQRGAEQRWLRIRTVPRQIDEHGVALHMLLLDVTTERQLSEELFGRKGQEGLGVLAAGIAHNFNNMLSVITPNIHVALEHSDGLVAEALKDARRAADEAADLVRRLMVLAGRNPKGSGGGAVDLVEIVEDTVKICNKTFHDQVEIELHKKTNFVPVELDRASELRQVLLNLLFNARDATLKTRPPRVEVSIALEDTTARIEVVDNGEGFSQEVSRRLGEPFFTTKPVGDGSGLGLAFSIAVIRDLGGRLTWQSTPGAGARFTIEIPTAATP